MSVEVAPHFIEAGAQGRLGHRRPVAVVDIGSNSVRQVIYEGLARSPAVLFNEKVLCGLGKGVASTGRLREEAVEQAVAALTRFRALGRQARVQRTHVLATAAAREAANGPAFIERVEALFGQPVEVLTGAMEAHYAALGVRSGFHKASGIVGDMGGGSLELVAVDGGIGEGVTMPLGGLRLAEASGDSLSTARRIAKAELARAVERMKASGDVPAFYAIGGTWRSLAKLHIACTRHPLPVVHDYEVAAADYAAFCEKIVEGPVESLPGIDTVSRNRRQLLPYGALVMAETIAALGADIVSTSSLGVREGYLFSLLSRSEQEEDSLLAAAHDLSVLRARSPHHSEELAQWTGEAFATLGIEESENEARWRIASCYLADIAWRAHPDFRAQQSLAVISNTGFVGITHEGRGYLALANYHRYQGLGSKVAEPSIGAVVGERARRRARLLAALFRVLYLFSASMPGIIPQMEMRKDYRGFQLSLPRALGGLVGERPRERVTHLARELGEAVELSIR